MNGVGGCEINVVEQFPSKSHERTKYDIDRVFAESAVMGRPRSTCIYSLVVNNTFRSSPIEEVAVVSTNNRYLQNQDHKLYIHIV